MTPLVATFDGVISTSSARRRRPRQLPRHRRRPRPGDRLVRDLHPRQQRHPGHRRRQGHRGLRLPARHRGRDARLAGQLVAWRGDSGNAESTGPHLHFELRKGSGWSGVVYNAFPSLRAATHLAVPGPSGPTPTRAWSATPAAPTTCTTAAPSARSARPPSSPTRSPRRRLSWSPTRSSRSTARSPDCPCGRGRSSATPATPGASPARAATSPPRCPGSPWSPSVPASCRPCRVLEAPALPSEGMLVRWQSLLHVVGQDGRLRVTNRFVLASWGLPPRRRPTGRPLRWRRGRRTAGASTRCPTAERPADSGAHADRTGPR